MGSFYAELHVGGYVFPLRSCAYEFTQATGARGRPVGKVHPSQIRLVMDVPPNNFLEGWAAAVYKPLPGYIVFYTSQGRAAEETLAWEEGHCVYYGERFQSGSLTQGSYVCDVHIASPKLTWKPGGPGPYVAPAPREHGTPLPPALATSIQAAMSAPQLSKQQRYDARMSLMGRARTKLAAGPNKPAQTALARLQRNNVAVERARLSSHVYHSLETPPEPAPEGWHMLNAKELASRGVTPAMLLDPESGFKAALYQSSFERPPKLVVAYAGTEDTPDMKADFIQGLGLENQQYNRAMRLAQNVLKTSDKDEVDVTGHSLGGGLASAASVVTGTKGYTFNAAGLHKATVGRAPYNVPYQEVEARGRLLDAYHSAADPLTNAQVNSGPTLGPGLPRALGVPHELAPAAHWQHKWGEVSSRHPLDASTKMALDGHGIDPQMVDHIEAEKDQDTATLTKFVAPTP